MTASLIPVSFGPSMVFTKDEATAAQATWLFFLTNTADGSVATGKTIATTDFKISKNGAAFGNATGVVTEISLGWYKMVFSAGDLDTLGTLACELSGEAGVDPIHVAHQVVAFDLNTATVAPTAGSIAAASFAAGAITAAVIADGAIDAATFAAGAITAASIATDAIDADALNADAVTEMQVGLATTAVVQALSSPLRNVTRVLGTLEADGSTGGTSMQGAVKAIVTLAGTWDSSTVTVEYCPNPLATVPQWIAYAAGRTTDGTVVVTGPVNAIRATMSDDGAASEIVCTAEISYAARS